MRRLGRYFAWEICLGFFFCVCFCKYMMNSDLWKRTDYTFNHMIWYPCDAESCFAMCVTSENIFSSGCWIFGRSASFRASCPPAFRQDTGWIIFKPFSRPGKPQLTWTSWGARFKPFFFHFIFIILFKMYFLHSINWLWCVCVCMLCVFLSLGRRTCLCPSLWISLWDCCWSRGSTERTVSASSRTP